MPSITKTLIHWRPWQNGADAGASAGAIGAMAGPEQVWLAHVAGASGAAQPRLLGHAKAEATAAEAARRFGRARGQRKAPMNQLLGGAQYQVLQLEAPAVPRAEWAAATRWQIKDYIDFDPAEAHLDCVAIPVDDGSPGKRMFTVVTRQDTVRQLMLDHRRLRNNLQSIDVPEMALRNLLLLAGDGPAQALLHLGQADCWIVLLWNAELATTRRIEIGLTQLAAADAEDRFGLVERLALEFQRTSDAFARVYTQGDLRCLWVSACAQSQELATVLGGMLAVSVRPFELGAHMDGGHDLPLEPEFLLAVGAALRQTEKAA